MNDRWLALSLGLLAVGLWLALVGWTTRGCTLVGCPESAKHAPRLVVRWYGLGFSDGCNVCTLDAPALLAGGALSLAGLWTGGRKAV